LPCIIGYKYPVLDIRGVSIYGYFVSISSHITRCGSYIYSMLCAKCEHIINVNLRIKLKREINEKKFSQIGIVG